MLKNKIALKLSLYFAVALIVFSIILIIGFSFLFMQYTVTFHQSHLSDHAKEIAAQLSAYDFDNTDTKDTLLDFLVDISVNSLWIVENDGSIIAKCNGLRRNITLDELSDDQIRYINELLTGESLFSNNFLADAVKTVGIPIKTLKNNQEEISGAILLHYFIEMNHFGIPKYGVIKAFILSCGIALAITFVLSLFLSKNFTEPIILKEAEDAIKLEKIRREFVANISHELKTPIYVIKLSLEAILNKVVVEPVTKESYLKQIFKETTFLERLVNDLLDLSRLQNMDYSIEKRNISLCELIYDVMRSSIQIANKKNVEIQLMQEIEDCEIYGDYGRIRQMIMIIIDNAIKFSLAYNKVKILLSDKELTVIDNGIGISETNLPYIFDKFYKSRSEQNKSGTGLGLAIAKQIADRHGIELSVQSKEGIGTTVKFHF